jgi:uncharacterized protein YkwD
MRFLTWSAVAFVVVALSVGATSVARNHLVSSRAPTATPQVAAAAFNGVDAGDPAPQRMIPRPSPDPTPSAAPAATPHAAAPVRSAPAATHPAPRPALVIGSAQQSLINRDRAASGLGPLTWSSCLASVARSNAVRMETQDYISHTNGPTRDLSCGLGRQAGENVGWWSGGVNDAQLNTMFMNSPDHRANILGPYHYVATSWAVAPNGHAYIAVEFS